jgi:D-arabinose 5-phosphate isomerase GutQ
MVASIPVTTAPDQAVSSPETSTAAKALAAAGDVESARDVSALDAAARQAAERLGRRKKSLVERLI